MLPLGDFRFPIEEGQVRRFAEASWDSESAHQAVSGDLRSLPPTYLGAAATICGRPHSLALMGFDVARAFHGMEVIEQLAPVVVGEVLKVHEWLDHLTEVRGRRGGSMKRAVRKSDFYNQAGILVARTERMILEAETSAPASPPANADLTVFDEGLEVRRDPVLSLAVPPGALQPGVSLTTASFGPLTRTDFVRYAAASGDMTAVHFDEHAAAAKGYPGPFAMGMLSAAFIGHVLKSWIHLTPPWRLGVRFREQVWPGETLEISGAVRSARGHVHIEVECRGSRRLVTSASLEIGSGAQ